MVPCRSAGAGAGAGTGVPVPGNANTPCSQLLKSVRWVDHYIFSEQRPIVGVC